MQRKTDALFSSTVRYHGNLSSSNIAVKRDEIEQNAVRTFANCTEEFYDKPERL